MRVQFSTRMIKKNHVSNTPSQRLYLDTETRIFKEGKLTKLPFRLAVTCYEDIRKSRVNTKEQWNEFTKPEDLCNYIIAKSQKKSTLYVFAHNAGFDVIVSCIIHMMSKDGWQRDFYYDKGLVFILAVSKDKAKIKFLSTTNFFPASLAKIGTMINLPKLDCDIKQATQEQLFTYCRRDVEIIKEAMHVWFDILKKGDYGGFRQTKAAQSLSAYRHRFMRFPIYPHNEPDVQSMEKESYCGGRVECFKIGHFNDGPFVKLDFNSNYAYVMSTNPYPTKLSGYLENIGLDYLKELLDSYSCCAEVVLNTDVPLYPIKCHKMLYFPIGQFKAVINTPALKEALKRGHIQQVRRIACYEQRFIFESFIDHFFPLKEKYSREGNLILRSIYKDIMNSLYGKFAEKTPLYEEHIDNQGPVAYRMHVFIAGEIKKRMETKLLNVVSTQTGEKDAKHNFTAISAHVTEYARFLLWREIERLGCDRVYYCDTDSIICKEKDMHLIIDRIDSEKIGYLSIEKHSDEATIVCPKHYIFGDEVKMKGIPKNHTKICENTYKYESFMKMTSLLREGNINKMYTKEVIKTLTNHYKKGKVMDDGTVLPFLLPDDAALL